MRRVLSSLSRKSERQSPLVTSPVWANPRISGSRGAAGVAVPLMVAGASAPFTGAVTGCREPRSILG